MNKTAIILILIVLIAAGFYFLKKESIKTNMQITSSAFQNNERIPAKFTCDGVDTSPQLSISDVPENAKSLAIVMDDPDAPGGIWVHWMIWNINSATKEIPEGGKIGMEGITSFGRVGYGGPCPPFNPDRSVGAGTHRYFFKLYALDTMLDLPTSAKAEDLDRAMVGHILDNAQIIGLYSRK